MNCLKREKQIALYVEGDLPETEAAILARHIEGCTRCQQLVHRLEESQSIVRAMAKDPIPSAFYEDVPRRVMAATASAAVGQRKFRFPWEYSWRWKLGLAGATAALVAGIWIGADFFNHTGKDKQMARQSVSSPDLAATSKPLSVSPRQPPQPAPQVKVGKSSGQLDRTRRGKTYKADQQRLLSKASHLDGKNENQPTLAEIHRAMALWQEMTANVEEMKNESTKAKSTEVPDRLVAKLETKDPNVIIYWLEDAKKGNANEIQN